MKKILLITYEYPPDIGGIANYLAFESRNFYGDVRVVRAQEMEWKRISRIFNGSWLPILWRLKKILRQNKPDALWVSHVLPVGYVSFLYKKLFKIPYRVYVHGLDLICPRTNIWKKFFVKKILHEADEIIANSNATAELLEEYGIQKNEHIKSGRLIVRYPGIEKINIDKYKTKAAEIRRKYEIESKIVLLTVSRLVPRKGIDLVIRALPSVFSQISNLVYAVAGDGPERDYLEKYARGYSNIFFLGSISDEEKYAWIAACDCFILTPRDDPNDFEGYGIVYKEAQMFGKPVIASRIGGVPEAVGENGTMVDAGSVYQITQAILKNIKTKPNQQTSSADLQENY